MCYVWCDPRMAAGRCLVLPPAFTLGWTPDARSLSSSSCTCIPTVWHIRSQYPMELGDKKPKEFVSESFSLCLFKGGLVLTLPCWHIPQWPDTSPRLTWFHFLGSCWWLKIFYTSAVKFWYAGSPQPEDFLCHWTCWKLFSIRTTFLLVFWCCWKMSCRTWILLKSMWAGLRSCTLLFYDIHPL